MRKFSLLIAGLLITFNGFSQAMLTFDATQAINAAKEIAVQKINSELSKVMAGDISGVLETTDKLVNLTENYQEELKKINPFILKSENVKYLFEIQSNITMLYGKNVYRYDRNFTSEERKVYRKTLKAILEDSFRELENLDVLLEEDFYAMSDGERINILGSIEDRLRNHEKDMIEMEKFGKTFYNAAERVKGGNRYIK
ncbi:hypothetical protein [Parapedobacter sp. 10938]|uniref:hypothetical protein n=1 Tax=Parapedobacter flavus TaxID=3110225 RepID=UPI002DBE3780|nr:hypothetical protein [Parapedobacter sp. 10938]MEC3881830.1 hypothetical protein [Parapedobacter sp. 10938]